MVAKTRVVDRKTLPEYPFDIGYRYVHDGHESVQVPLTEGDFLHPQEDDRFLFPDAHTGAVGYLRHALAFNNARRGGFRVFSNHRIDFQTVGIKPMGPDVIAFGEFHAAWNPHVGTLPVGDLGIRPLIVAEVTWISVRHTDLNRKPNLYRRCGVPHYLIFDLYAGTGPRFESELIAYHRAGKRLVRTDADPEYGVWVPSVEMWFKMDGIQVVAHDLNKQRIPSALELSQRREAAVDRMMNTEAEANRHRRWADALEKELAELRAKLAAQTPKKNGHK